jgi:hypothetical protein
MALPAFVEYAPTTVAVALVESAHRRLHNHAYPALKNIHCVFQEGTLILRGSLPTYYLKQLAQTAVTQIDGVNCIRNEICVVGEYS